MAGGLPLASNAHYAMFLSAQYTAREALERAFETQPPRGLPSPPRQTPMIADDLRVLGRAHPTTAAPITFANADAALGAAWVVSGSSLGNRTLLAQRRKAGLHTPEAFLSDDAMPLYFRQLLHLLDRPASPASFEHAIIGARQAFALFETAFSASQMEQAA